MHFEGTRHRRREEGYKEPVFKDKVGQGAGQQVQEQDSRCRCRTTAGNVKLTGVLQLRQRDTTCQDKRPGAG